MLMLGRDRGDYLAREISGKPFARQQTLALDPRTLHRKLFGTSEATGRFRSRAGPAEGRVVVHSRSARGRPLAMPGAPVEDVARAMRELKGSARSILDHPPAVDDVPEAMAHLLARFFLIHPFQDGNGRTGRLMVAIFAGLLGRPFNDTWTVDRRPYGLELTYSLFAYSASPAPMTAILRRHLSAERG